VQQGQHEAKVINWHSILGHYNDVLNFIVYATND